jgi:hypothetical protein
MDQLFLHELDLKITPAMVKARQAEWVSRTTGCKSRSEYIAGLCAFMGLELLEYHIASCILEPKTGVFTVQVRSQIWQKRQA